MLRIPSSVPVLTNPLTLYRSLIATKQIDPDPSQHRLAIHLQKLYFRLIDYSPQLEYAERLKAISRVVQKPSPIAEDRQLAAPGHPLRQNPLFAHLFHKKEQHDSLALIRVLTSYEEAMKLRSPQGLLVHGEVGSGKSMLVDLLADGLPNRKKKRWHFNTFMLEILARLEQLRRTRSEVSQDGTNSEHSLLRLAKDMIDESAILFLDEFQLPDKAASKILSQLLTAFFQLGGVLIATSNRMPEELSKASGVEFTTPRSRISSSLFAFRGKERFFSSPASHEYAGFVEVLKARCEIWNMEGERDWRRREAEEIGAEPSHKSPILKEKSVDALQQSSNIVDKSKNRHDVSSSLLPKMYILKSSTNDKAWKSAIRLVLSLDTTDPIIWESKTLSVYAREVVISRHLNGVTYWKFSEICGSFLGSANYISLASTFHSLILDDVPVITVHQKNEARRFITLLDALYEARCKLLIRAEVGPDEIFFPEISAATRTDSRLAKNDHSDAVYSETISEIYQDQTLPFRPNISAYGGGFNSNYESDQNPNLDHGSAKGKEIGPQIDFGLTSSFTGEDERFAYKRARSRLWEMCGARWHARSESKWWQPLPAEIRRWECSTQSRSSLGDIPSVKNDIKMGASVELDKPAGLQGIEVEQSDARCVGSCREEPARARIV